MEQNKHPLSALYEEDEIAWAEKNVNLLESGQISEVDALNLAVCLAEMVSSERRALENELTNLLMHLLKKKYQPQMATSSWDRSIRNCRRQLRMMTRSKNQFKYAEAIFSGAYEIARKDASAETRLMISTFPVVCPFSFEEVIHDD